MQVICTCSYPCEVYLSQILVSCVYSSACNICFLECFYAMLETARFTLQLALDQCIKNEVLSQGSEDLLVSENGNVARLLKQETRKLFTISSSETLCNLKFSTS